MIGRVSGSFHTIIIEFNSQGIHPETARLPATSDRRNQRSFKINTRFEHRLLKRRVSRQNTKLRVRTSKLESQ